VDPHLVVAVGRADEPDPTPRRTSSPRNRDDLVRGEVAVHVPVVEHEQVDVVSGEIVENVACDACCTANVRFTLAVYGSSGLSCFAVSTVEVGWLRPKPSAFRPARSSDERT
jgi:hypothetical protein